MVMKNRKILEVVKCLVHSFFNLRDWVNLSKHITCGKYSIFDFWSFFLEIAGELVVPILNDNLHDFFANIENLYIFYKQEN